VQAPLFGALALQTTDRGFERPSPKPKRAILRGRLVPLRKRVEEQQPEPPLPKDAQVVEVNQPEEQQPKPSDTKLVADRTVRTKKRTRSRRTARPDKSRTPGKTKVVKPSPVQSPDSESPKPTVTPKEERDVALRRPRQKFREADRGTQASESVLQAGSKAKLLLPSTSAQAELANIQALNGTFATDDYLRDVPRDDSTVLDANKYKFADFFYQVKEAVRRHWNPNAVYRRRDPTGRLYGVKDRHTILRVTLDPAGRLKQLIMRRHSGLDFMDAEAMRAMRRAQPFPNPPQGLVRDGKITFDFGFYFEITAGKYRFRWKRL